MATDIGGDGEASSGVLELLAESFSPFLADSTGREGNKMQTHLACIPCIIRQALEAARHVAPEDENLQRRVIQKVCSEIPDIPVDMSPPILAEWMHALIYGETGVEDPYKEAKARNVELAYSLEPRIKEWIEGHNDPFQAAVRVAITGNIIDLGASPNFDLNAELDALESSTIDLDDLESLRSDLKEAEDLLYIGDNTAEAIFDKALIHELQPRNIYFGTRSRPVLNDITVEGAYELGLDEYATIISTGSGAPGVDLRRANETFRRLFYSAPVVISKGQGNFETLSHSGRTVYFLFKVKCPVVAAMTGKEMGSSIIFRGGRTRWFGSAEDATRRLILEEVEKMF